METRANHAAVGGFVLVLTTAIVAFTVWFMGASLTRGVDRYRIRFDGPVRGLSQGSNVSLLGVTVGQIERIRLDPEHFGKIDVTIAVEAGTPIVEGAEAELRMQGLTGTSFVLITGGSEGAPAITAPPGETLPVIPSKQSQLEKLASSVPEIAERVSKLLARLEGFLTEENAEGFSRIVDNIDKTMGHIEAITAGLEQDSDSITAVLADVRSVAGRVDNIAAGLETDVPKITKKVGTTLDEVEDLARDLKAFSGKANKLAGNVDAMVSENRPGVRRFTSRGLYEITNLATRLQRVADDISRLARTFSAASQGAFNASPGGRRR
ncbi:MAG: MlaD family protein [Nannocystaceae bacterium]|nr:MCE family protein [Myxococcales bacterium]